MAAMFNQMIVLYGIASLCFVAFMLPTVLCGVDSQTTPINYKPIANYIQPCSEKNQENCVTHSPPINIHKRPCNPSDRCRGGGSQAGKTESKAQVSAATEQFGVDDHTLLDLVFAMAVGWVLFLFW
ncbi:uncharacterized protein LOC111299994 [Durio zibethinus]|uniref:Uncharacterized protein LOC111299994 n=1 Tax=Durio zibethinus TaxID=66656 RepID=A0A6P5ZET5_DURZI|nr:uncharacterized protein LOC111299994 [Durio zibethinus]XP_022751287.1 uncharacterized protein LOC111299994 [Durio zibethinus]XP_022751288.1 uncharacterized protein LOC111299994 [Durio zibethinus]XP_022751289.1 uncharacterized protein LOC111299994 [Durio zibethinus]XP_022751290.1 uncharacterized protein LOC111299994 [Durio zibethinus]